MNENTLWLPSPGGSLDRVATTLRDMEVLNTPLLNRGTTFPQELRDALALNGLLPPHIVTREQQVAKSE